METKPSVLYVEDDHLSRKLMGLLLKGRLKLPNVTMFENSESFLERLETIEPKPDVILLDIHVKPYNGFEMLAMLRQIDWAKELPIIALTASVMNEEVNQLTTAGFNGCIAKPIDLDTFPDMLERIMGGESIWRIIN
jgi:CheY-like chemotaxis protein